MVVFRLIAVVALSSALLGCAMRIPESASPSVFPKNPASFSPPKVNRENLSNGLRIFYARDPEIPMVQGELLLPRGTFWGSKENPAAFGAMAQMMRDAGAGDLGPQDLDRELQNLAAGIESKATGEITSISFSCLKGDFPRVAQILADVVVRPRFDEGRLEVWRGINLDAVKRRGDDGETIAAQSVSELIYGDTIYGKPFTSADISGLKRIDLLRLHRRFIRPEGAILSLSGDIDLAQAKGILEAAFAGWTGKPEGSDEPPPVEFEPKPGIYFLEFPFVQSLVRIGQQGPKRLTPDYLAIEAFNQIFGTSMLGSRLMNRIREELGYTYGIYGAITPGVQKGMNLISFETQAQATGNAVVESVKVLEGLTAKEPQPEELSAAKLNVSNSFVFKFDAISELVKRRALIDIIKYPEDYDETYLPGLEKVAAADVLRVAQSRWDLSKLVILVVGNRTAYNSLETSLKDAPEYLRGMKIQKVEFFEKLKF